MKTLALIPMLLAVAGFAQQAPGKLVCKEGFVQFFSKAPLEDILAKSNTAVSIYDATSGLLKVKMTITSFQFSNKLMQEHFNENYMESSQFPNSDFVGLVEGADWAAIEAGKTDSVTVNGQLEIHGVKKSYKVTGTLAKTADGKYQGKALFPVHIADHGITVPKMVVKNIAENVDLTVDFLWSKEVAK